jgi:hypothetical protein
MKSLSFVFFVLYSLTSLYSQQFHSLDGIEDDQGNTLLMYRLGEEFFFYNPVYKLNTQSLSETLLMQAFYINYPSGEIAKAVWDFEFFPNDPDNFMNVGYEINPDNHGYIARNDSIVFGGFEGYWKVDISKQNPLKVFVFGGAGEIRSWDGGYTFPIDSIPYVTNFIPIALADFDDNVMFGFDEDLNFCRNGGVVDTSLVIFDEHSELLYDVNQYHVYRVNKTYGGYSLNVSNNKGNAFSWTKTYQSENPIYITIDSTQSGMVYLADGKQIYKSTNNGYNFYPYKSLPSKLIGIYKKPNSEFLYAASKYKIFEVRSDTTVILKSLPIPAEVFDWFPLAVGNRWVYKVTTLDDNCFWPIDETEECIIITKDTVINGNNYFKFEPPLAYQYEFMRIDSTEGKLKTIFSYQDSVEATLYNFLMEVGDTVLFVDPIDPYDGFVLVNEDIQTIFGESRQVRNFMAIWFLPPPYSLVKGIGYYRDGFCEFGGYYRTLKGCLIDGIVYGDTTFTDVDNELNSLPTEYKLEQNYPNPFNPSTKISWQSPVSGWQTLKVFDVLGKEVATLVDEFRNVGSYEVEFNPVSSIKNPASGIYFYQLKAGEFVDTKKMMLIK